MKYFNFDNVPSRQTLTIDKFLGVDFLTHPTKVDLSRSPDCLNMIADKSFFPRKRVGYKKILTFENSKINGLFYFKTDDQKYYLCHAGTVLYRFYTGETPHTQLFTGLADAPSKAFVMNNKLYILDGKKYLQFDGEQAVNVESIAFVPTTTINAPPQGGGTFFEAVNLLTPKRINTFVGNGTTKTFQLDAKSISAPVTATVNGAEVTAFTVNYSTGVVTFTSAPTNGAGIANVIINFSKTVANSANKINKCRFFGMYGGKNDTRVFLSGNPDEINVDFASGLYDATYFPDTGYTKIGSDSSAIMGYARQYESQIVIKEGNGQDATQYLRTFSIDGNGSVLYPVKQGAKGSGAVSSNCFATLGDIPYFLSSEGICGVFGTNVSETRTIANLSERINPKLLSHQNLNNAVGYVFRNKYYLAIDTKCYVADGNFAYSSGQPEWFYWDNIPATCFMDDNEHLFFGTSYGEIMCFHDEDDENPYNDNGVAIHSYWSTPFSALGSWHIKKTISDIFPVLMPYLRSGVYVQFNTESKLRNKVFERNVDLFSFIKLNFSRLSFKSIKTANIYRDKQRIRGVRLFQIIVGNDRNDEAFGILAIILKYIYGSQIR